MSCATMSIINIDHASEINIHGVGYSIYIYIYTHTHTHTKFVQKVSELTTVHEVVKAYGVLTLIVFNIVPFRSYTLRPTFPPLLVTFCKLIFRDV